IARLYQIDSRARRRRHVDLLDLHVIVLVAAVLKVLQELRPGQLTFTLEQDIAVWANRLRGEIGYRPAHADELAHASEEFRKLNQAADVIISQKDSADAKKSRV